MNTLITDDRLKVISELASFCALNVPGQFAEVGVYKGGSLKVIAEAGRVKQHVLGFDTFEGLPEEHYSEDEPHKPGDFSDTSLEAVKQFLAPYKLSNITLVKGLFPDSGKPYEDMQFGFVHIDTDFYQAVKASLDWFWPRMASGGIIVFDDYEWGNCPGVEKALIEFGQPIYRKAAYQAYIQKP